MTAQQGDGHDVLRADAIRAALFAHDGMERLIREDGLPREAVEPEPVGFLAALEGLGFTVAALPPQDEPGLRATIQKLVDQGPQWSPHPDIRDRVPVDPEWGASLVAVADLRAALRAQPAATGLAGEREGPTLTTEEALRWFGEPRYSVTDLQRAWAEGAAADRAERGLPLDAIDVERLTEAMNQLADTDRLILSTHRVLGTERFRQEAGPYRELAEKLVREYARLAADPQSPTE